MTLRLIERIIDAICGHHNGPPPPPVDVAAKLDAMAGAADQRLDWRHSVVDLLKLLGIDSGREHREQLADELHYPGDRSNNPAMNEWLRKEVMNRLAENGGRVPSELL